MATRCVDCKVEKLCPYSANKIYIEDDLLKASLYAVHPNPTKENLKEAIKTGPYGRCIYKCDNNVVDHMVTILEFEDNISATFNLSAFTKECSRTIKLMFTHGEVGGNFHKNIIDIYKFGDRYHKIIYPKVCKSSHGGGDFLLFHEFIEAVNSNKNLIKTSAITSVESHVMAFAAEYSRLNHEVVNLYNFINK